MSLDKDLIETIRTLEETGQQFIDQMTAHGSGETPIDSHDFHRWRVETCKRLYLSLGPSNYYYECFWKSVTRPSLDHVQEGLRLLATVKSELQAILPPAPPVAASDRETAGEVVLPEF
ncbi:MAG: hypothetical protein HY913_17495 [Desulfomonile tiedjei]|nr:hypothetical protein [Desulfomonile tiedjei]